MISLVPAFLCSYKVNITSICLHYFILRMNHVQLIIGPQGVLTKPCNCFTINYFDGAKLKAEC